MYIHNTKVEEVGCASHKIFPDTANQPPLKCMAFVQKSVLAMSSAVSGHRFTMSETPSNPMVNQVTGCNI